MSTNPSDLQQLSALLDQLEIDPEPTPERRQHPRTEARTRVPVCIEIDGSPTPINGTLRDMSRSGVGLLLPSPLTPGTRFTFRAIVGPRAVKASYRVANCRPNPTGPGHIVGAALLQAERSPAPAPAPAQSPRTGASTSLAADIDQQHLADLRRRLSDIVGNC